MLQRNIYMDFSQHMQQTPCHPHQQIYFARLFDLELT
ncbi:hypothetical protein VIRA109638_07635 [Vibrio rarus]